jgi:hypothetical protein
LHFVDKMVVTTCTCVVSILLPEPSEDVAAGRSRRALHRQIVRLVDKHHDSVLGHVHAEQTPLVHQGEETRSGGSLGIQP